jgi:hypothetical protein
MVKHEDMVVYKNIGTYHLVTDDGYDEDTDTWYEPFRHYEVRHFSGLEVTASSVKECKKCLDDFEVTAQEIRAAINKLAIYGYRVFKEQEYKDTSTDPNGLKAFSRNYAIL